MAIGSNSSDKQVIGGLYTGIAPLKVVAINPNMEKLKAMGINATKEPEYVTTDETKGGLKKCRVDIYLAHPTLSLSKATKLTFWLEDRHRPNQKNDKYEYINKFGTTAWSSSASELPSVDWFSKEGARPALVGEGDLVNWIKAWANTGTADQAVLDNPGSLFTGNYTELNQLFGAIATNQFRGLLGVKDGKYQTVYTKYFNRLTQANVQGFIKALEGEYSAFKDDYQKSLDFKPYVGNTTVNGDSPTDVGSQDNSPKYNF